MELTLSLVVCVFTDPIWIFQSNGLAIINQLSGPEKHFCFGIGRLEKVRRSPHPACLDNITLRDLAGQDPADHTAGSLVWFSDMQRVGRAISGDEYDRP